MGNRFGGEPVEREAKPRFSGEAVDTATEAAPAPAPSPVVAAPKDEKDPIKEMLYATGLGGIFGLATPEVTMATGKVLEKVPYTPVRMAGKSMQAAAPSMTGVGQRLVGGGLGATGGFTGEASGQIAEAFGAPQPVAESARIVGGILPLELAAQTVRGGSALARYIASKIPGFNIVRSVMDDVGAEQLVGKQKELVKQRIQELRQSPFATDDQKKIYDVLLDEVNKAKSLADLEANWSRLAGEQVSKEERKAATSFAGMAGELQETKKTIIQRAKDAIRDVGDSTRDLSQIGTSLRDKILSRFETGSLERSAQYKEQKKIRDAVVAGKEGQGILVESMPEYKSLVQDLRNKLLKGKIAQQQKIAPVTEPGVLKAYQNIYDAVTARRVEIGVNEMGNPVYKTFPTSFDALDDVRRRLGDAAFGKAAEGYEALGQKIAEEYYAKISNIQSKFAGESHDTLQGNYELASRLLEKFRTKAGAKATAMDRIDPTQFKTDAKSLPATLFNSQQSVADAIALTGDRNLVVQEARNYVAKNLANMNASQAKNWLTGKTNSDWLSALPEVRQTANAYVANLERAEQRAVGTAKVEKKMSSKETQALKESGRALEAGEKKAVEITDAARKDAERILGTKEPAAQVSSIILSGDRTMWDRIAPAIAASPNGQQVLESAVRQVMADKASQGIFSAERFWQTSLKDSLARTGLMSPDKINEISRQLNAIATSTLPEQQKLTLFGRTMKNIIITYGVPGTRRTYNVITGAGQPTSMEPGAR
jgi:hypothetical protein